MAGKYRQCTGFTDIPLATAEAYTAGALTQTTYYRRGAFTATDLIAYTGSVTVMRATKRWRKYKWFDYCM
jgi:hypothetical protein